LLFFSSLSISVSLVLYRRVSEHTRTLGRSELRL
jgi:hypothetical protein